MAKELPYFKFEPNQWENGNIQICTREDKGLFLDLCSMYWSRLGDVPFKLAVQKLCGGNASAFDTLINEGIFTLVDEDICIDFLNEQLSEFDNISEKNSKAAKLRWEKHRKQKELSERNASALITQCENDAIRGEKIREDKYNDKSFLESWSNARKHYLKKPTHIKKLDFNETNYFKDLIKDYTPEEIKTGIYGLFKQKNKNISSMYLKPKHFLENFVKYYNAELSKDYELYGSGEKAKEQL